MDVRPTSDRLRETIFNVLSASQSLENSCWIDLFAGTGAIGIEAISRGAGMVYFVERSPKVARIIESNLQTLGISNGSEIVLKEAVDGLHDLEKRGVVCDFVFLDPPYRDAGSYEAVLRVLAASSLLGQQSIVLAEHTKHFDPGDGVPPLNRYRSLRQGDAALSFYRRIPTT